MQLRISSHQTISDDDTICQIEFEGIPDINHDDLLSDNYDIKSISTAATTPTSDDDDGCSSVGNDSHYNPVVSFAELLVNSIYYRPATSDQEKYQLYYCNEDYRRFKNEARGESTLRMAAPPRRVHFSPLVVTSVKIRPNVVRGIERDTLYYSKDETKRMFYDFQRRADEIKENGLPTVGATLAQRGIESALYSSHFNIADPVTMVQKCPRLPRKPLPSLKTKSNNNISRNRNFSRDVDISRVNRLFQARMIEVVDDDDIIQ